MNTTSTQTKQAHRFKFWCRDAHLEWGLVWFEQKRDTFCIHFQFFVGPSIKKLFFFFMRIKKLVGLCICI